MGGAFGLATAGIAWYVSFAIALNNTAGRNLLLLGSFWGPPGDRA